jgi:hypothetical protein
MVYGIYKRADSIQYGIFDDSLNPIVSKHAVCRIIWRLRNIGANALTLL